MKKQFIILVVLQAAVMFLSTCGQKGPLPPPDKTPPSVVNTIPANAATNVPITLDNGVVVTFSKAMDASTINDRTIMLTYNGGNGKVPVSSVTYGDANGQFAATIIPFQALKPVTLYTITVTNDVRDTYGNAMTAKFTSSFMTGATTPLRVIDVQPAGRSKNVSTTTVITIIFSEPVEPSTILPGTIKLSALSGDIQGTVSYNRATDSATFKPGGSLSPSTTYNVTVLPGVKGLSGSAMTDAFASNFETGPGLDVEAPMVLPEYTLPAENASMVDVNSPVSVTFSEPMILSDITPSTIVVTDGADEIPGTIKYVDRTVIFMPDNPLAPSSDYAVGIHRQIRDLAKNLMASDYIWSFTTQPDGPDNIAPDVVSTFPASEQDSVPVYKQIVALCSEAMLASSITPSTFAVVDANGTSVPGRVTSDGATLVFTPTQPLAYSTTYFATVTPGASDLAGNTLAGNSADGYVWTFTTEAIATFDITVTASDNGSITPSGTITLASGATQTFIITPDAGYHIMDVMVDNRSVGAISTYRFANVTSDHTLSARFTNDTYTITATAGPNGSITPSGSATVNSGTTQTFTIAPSAGYHVTDVLVDGASVGPMMSYTFSNVTANHTISASFTIDTYTVSPSVSGGNGTISPTTAQIVSYNTATSFTVTPAEGYTAVMGGTCGGSLSGNTYTTDPVMSDCTVVASFSMNTNTIMATVSGGNGTISPSGSVAVNYGGSQTFTFTPVTGNHVASVTVDGIALGVPLPGSYTFNNVTTDHTIAVRFALDTFTLTPSAGPNGNINPSTVQTVNYGSSAAFTFIPNSGYYISAVTVDGNSVGLPNQYTFYNVTQNHTITVSFSLGSYLITATAGAGGTLATGGAIVSSGTSQEFLVNASANRLFTITPNTGFHTADVLVDGVSVGPVASYPFENVSADHTISASFAVNTYTVTPSVGSGSGTISPTTAQLVSYNSTTTFTVTPAAGYTAVMGGTCGGSLNGTIYTTNPVTSDCTVVASFSLNTSTITAAVSGGNGTISPSGSVAVSYGADQTFTFSPATGSHVSSVTVDGVSLSAPLPATYTFSNVTADHSIAVGFSLDTFTLTPSAGPNGNISPSTVQTVNYGSSTTFTFIPDSGYDVSTVTVDGVNVGLPNQYTFYNVTQNHTIDVSFSIHNYIITATAGVGGTLSMGGSIVSSGTSQDFLVNASASRTFTITPNDGYHITDVLVDGVSVGAVTSYTFDAVSANHTISASFAINAYTVTPSIEPGAEQFGTISPSTAQTVSHNATVLFTVTPSEGYSSVVGGTCGGSLVGNTFTTNPVKGDCTVVANFAINAFTITATAGANGSISPSGAVPVNYGGNQTFTFIPNTGYHVSSVSVDGTPQSAPLPGSYTFNNVTANHTITVDFAVDTFTVTPSVSGGNGTISPTTAQTVNYNTTTSFTLTPAAGYHSVTPVGGTCGGSLVGNTFTTNAVTANCTIVASFAVDTFTVTPSAIGNGTISPAAAQTVNYNGTTSFILTPGTGNHLVTPVGGNCGGSLAGDTYTTNAVTADCTVIASFAVDTFTITATAGANGGISPSGAVTVNYGASQTFTFAPASGYTVSDVVVDGVSAGAAATYTFSAVNANHTIEVSFALISNAITATAGAGGTISPSGQVAVSYGSNQTFTIAPSTGYHIADVSIDGYSIGAAVSYTFTNVTSNHTISASFAIDTFTITATTGANGSISPSGTVTVNYGTSQTFTITSSAGYHVADVQVDGVSVGAVTSHTITNVTASHTINATFAIDTFTITASAGTNGSISPSGSVPVNSGADQMFTFAPTTAGYHISEVLVDGTPLSAPLPSTYTFTNVTTDHTISVSFAVDTFTITASAGTNGSISPSGSVTVNSGADQMFTFAPTTAGYHISEVLVDGTPLSAPLPSTYTFTNVTTDHTISVSFAIDTFTIATTSGPHGSINPSGSVTVPYGTNQTFTITPQNNYGVADVLVDGSSVGAVTSYTFASVTADHTISVSFAPNPTITASAGTGGTISPSGSVTVLYGANQTFTITPQSNYGVADVLVDGSSVGAVASYTFTNVVVDHTISASFVAITGGGGGTGF